VHATDVTNASRTLLFDIHELAWSDELCRIFDVPREILPEVRPSSGDYGTVAADLLGGPPAYCLEGSVFVAGALVGWLRDGLGLVTQAAEIEPLAASVATSGGVVIVPALTGLGAPHWDPAARGLVIGLARAALEAIALSVADVVGCMGADAGTPLQRLRVDGGATANDLLMQIQADVLGIPVERSVVRETTALGAALLAGLATGFYAGPAAVAAARRVERRFEPAGDEPARQRLQETWRAAVERSKGWAVGR
jgi:glycerol kinase